MEGLIWAFVGIVATAILSHYYYRRTIRKALAFFLLLDNKVLEGIDPELRATLRLSFAGRELPPDAAGPVPAGDQRALPAEGVAVTDLQQIQVIIANTAERAISFHQAPRFDIDAPSVVLDASILYQNPEDLGATVQLMPASEKVQGIVATAPLLNKGEFFVVKLLIDKYVDVGKLKLHLRADDLPRTIEIRPLPVEATKSLLEAVDWPAIWIGVTMIACSVATSFVVATLYEGHPLPSVLDSPLRDFLASVRLLHLAILGGVVSAILLFLGGVALTFGMGIQALLKRHRIVLPKELRPSQISRG